MRDSNRPQIENILRKLGTDLFICIFISLGGGGGLGGSPPGEGVAEDRRAGDRGRLSPPFFL